MSSAPDSGRRNVVRVRDVEGGDGRRAKRLLEAGHAGERQRTQGHAVVGAIARDRLGALRLAVREVVLADELPGGLHGLRAAAREEHVVERAWRNLGQPVGQLDRRRMSHTPVRGERKLDQLPARDLGHLGAERIAELGAEQVREPVEVAPAEAVDHEHALASLEHEQFDTAVAGAAVAREVEKQMVGGGSSRGHVADHKSPEAQSQPPVSDRVLSVRSVEGVEVLAQPQQLRLRFV